MYEKPKFGRVNKLANLIPAATNLLYGQTSKAIPVVIVRWLKYERSEKG
ncbi:MAG: hypothetical protein QXS32_08710 [Candidatus Nezhaarchaeales archaeon]